MKPNSITIVIILGTFLLVALLFLPTYLSDYRWLILSCPITLIIIREIYEGVPGGLIKRHWHRITYMIEPIDRADESDEEAFDTDTTGITGLWTGTARIQSSDPDGPIEILPITLMISESDRSVKVVPTHTGDFKSRITNVKVLEYDETSGDVDLTFVVTSEGRQHSFDTQLRFEPQAIVPEDETDPVTIELKRAQAKKVTIISQKPAASFV